jgi:hypothetical protein
MENTKDKATDLQIDKLLHKHLKDSPQNIECNGFDPDLAAAYAEKNLSGVILENYQNHLFACQNCRQMTTEYLLMFGEEVIIEEPQSQVITKEVVKKEEKKAIWTNLFSWLFASQIRWASAALVVVLISIVALMTYNSRVNTSTVAENNGIKNEKKNTPANSNDPKIIDPVENTTNTPNNVAVTDNKKDLVNTPEKNKGGKDNTQNVIPENKVENKEELANKNEPAVKLPNLKQGENLPDLAENNKNTPVNITNPLQTPPPPPPVSNNDIAQNTKENSNSIIPSNNPSSTKGEKLGIGLASGIEEEKIVAGKKFVLKKGVWTDKEFLSQRAKNLKKVELKSGSEEYKKVLSENAGLKPYFGVGKSVIVLYKDTIYLIK